MPGRSGVSRPLSPLRTPHDRFRSRSSSISKRHPCGMPRRLKTTSRYPVTVRIASLRAERTSQPEGRRHLLSLLSSDSPTSHVTRHLPNVSPPYGAGPVSTGIPTITAGPSLLSARQSGPPSACLAVSLPNGRRHRVPTFRIVDPWMTWVRPVRRWYNSSAHAR